MRLRLLFLLGTFSFGLAGCNSGHSSSTPTPTPSPTPTLAPQRLYVGNDQGAGTVRVFALPLSASSTAVAQLAVPSSVAIAVNALSLAVSDASHAVHIFTQPVTSSSSQTAGITTSNNGMMTFAASGNLYVVNGTATQIYTPPLTNASTPASTITTPAAGWGIAIDGFNNVYINGGSPAIWIAPAGVVTITATGPAGHSYRSMAVSGSLMAACYVDSSTGGIDVYSLPLSASSSPLATITSGTNQPEGCAFDNAGNLYAGNIGNGTIVEYAPPFTAASAPLVSLSLASGGALPSIYSIAIGP